VRAGVVGLGEPAADEERPEDQRERHADDAEHDHRALLTGVVPRGLVQVVEVTGTGTSRHG
jgi:hypothetical protein